MRTLLAAMALLLPSCWDDDAGGGGSCCKRCDPARSKPCGDSCTASANTCSAGPGCACYRDGELDATSTSE